MKKLIYLIGMLFIITACTENYSKGERVGTIVQFSKSGLIWESWDGQLNLTQTGMNTSGEPFRFSIDNDQRKEKGYQKKIDLINEAQTKGCKVKLIYHRVMGFNLFMNRGNTKHFVDSVIVLDKNFSKPLQQTEEIASVAISRARISSKDTIYVIIINK